MAYITRPNSWVSQDAAATTQLTYALQLNPAPLTVSTVTVCVWLVVLSRQNVTASGWFGSTDPKPNCVPAGSSALPDTWNRLNCDAAAPVPVSVNCRLPMDSTADRAPAAVGLNSIEKLALACGSSDVPVGLAPTSAKSPGARLMGSTVNWVLVEFTARKLTVALDPTCTLPKFTAARPSGLAPPEGSCTS